MNVSMKPSDVLNLSLRVKWRVVSESINLLIEAAESLITSYSVITNSRLGGVEAPDDWQGGLNITYRLGPGFIEELKDW